MTRTNEILRGQLEAFSAFWSKSGHDYVVEQWELQEIVRFSLMLYDSIVSMDTHWTNAVRSGQQEFAIQTAREIHDLYSMWDAHSEQVFRHIRAAQKAGLTIEGSDTFLRAFEDARLMAATDPDDLQASFKELEGGRGIPLEEVRDELRRRHVGAGQGRP